MVELGGLHEGGRPRGRHVETLALRDRQRARIGPRRHEDWNAQVVETGHVGETRDAERACMAAEARKRLGWRDRAMRAVTPDLAYGAAIVRRVA